MTETSPAALTTTDLAAFRERYVLAAYPTGGVAIDLQSGNYFRLNSTAAQVCLAVEQVQDPIDHIRLAFGLTSEEAAQIVGDVVRTLSAPSVHGVPQGSYHFYPCDSGYVLRHGAREVLSVDGTTMDIRVPAGFSTSESQMELYVRSLAPKLLFQRSMTVLHASACLVSGKVLAFAGLSGAGKTTTVRAFCASGAAAVSEDLVVLKPGARSPTAIIEAEASIQEWTRSVTRALMDSPDKAVPSGGLSSALRGRTAPVEQIVFLDRSRRRGAEFELETISEPDALVEVMAHDFLGTKAPEDWRRFFDSATQLVATTKMRRAWSPDGIRNLQGAATHYICTIAS